MSNQDDPNAVSNSYTPEKQTPAPTPTPVSAESSAPATSNTSNDQELAQTPQGQYWTPEYYEKDRVANDQRFGAPEETTEPKQPALTVPLDTGQPYQQSEQGVGAHGPILNNTDSGSISPILPSFNTAPLGGQPLPKGTTSIEREDSAWVSPNESKEGDWWNPDPSIYSNVSMAATGKVRSNEFADLQIANQFLTTSGTKFTNDAKTLFTQIAADPTLSRKLTENVTNNLSNLIDRYTKTAPNEIAASNFKQRATQQALSITDYSRKVERGNQITAYGADLKSQAAMLADDVYKNPANLTNALQDLKHSGVVAANSGLSREDVQSFLYDASKNITRSELSGLIESNPQTALKKLSSGAYDDKLSAAERRKFTSAAENAVVGRDMQVKGTFESRMSQIERGAYLDFKPENASKHSRNVQDKINQYNEYVELGNAIRQTPTNKLNDLAQSSSNPNLQRLAAQAVVERQRNPLDYAYKSKDVRPVILDGSLSSIQQHLLNVDTVERMYGQPVSKPLPSAYQKVLSDQLNSGDIKQVSSAVEQLKAFGSRAADAVQQVAGKHTKIQALIYAPDNATLSKIITGMNVPAGKNDSAYDVRGGSEIIKETFGPDFMKNAPGAVESMHYAALGFQSSDKSISYQDALKQSLGVTTLPQAGGWFSNKTYNTLLPNSNVSSQEFHDKISSLTNEDFAKFGNGIPVTTNPVNLDRQTAFTEISTVAKSLNEAINSAHRELIAPGNLIHMNSDGTQASANRAYNFSDGVIDYGTNPKKSPALEKQLTAEIMQRPEVQKLQAYLQNPNLTSSERKSLQTALDELPDVIKDGTAGATLRTLNSWDRMSSDLQAAKKFMDNTDSKNPYRWEQLHRSIGLSDTDYRDRRVGGEFAVVIQRPVLAQLQADPKLSWQSLLSEGRLWSNGNKVYMDGRNADNHGGFGIVPPTKQTGKVDAGFYSARSGPNPNGTIFKLNGHVTGSVKASDQFQALFKTARPLSVDEIHEIYAQKGVASPEELNNTSQLPRALQTLVPPKERNGKEIVINKANAQNWQAFYEVMAAGVENSSTSWYEKYENALIPGQKYMTVGDVMARIDGKPYFNHNYLPVKYPKGWLSGSGSNISSDPTPKPGDYRANTDGSYQNVPDLKNGGTKHVKVVDYTAILNDELHPEWYEAPDYVKRAKEQLAGTPYGSNADYGKAQDAHRQAQSIVASQAFTDMTKGVKKGSGAFTSTGRQIDFSDVKPDTFQYIPVSPGKYSVLLDGKPVRNAKGEEYLMDFGTMFK